MVLTKYLFLIELIFVQPKWRNLADALRSGRSGQTLMRVQIPPSAQELQFEKELFSLLEGPSKIR